MKIFNNEKYNTVAVYVLIVIIFTIFCVLVCINFDFIKSTVNTIYSVCKPLIYAFIFAFMLLPLSKLCENKILFFIKKRIKLKKMLAIILTYLIAFSVITFFGFIIVPQIIDSYTDLESKVGGYVSYAQNWIEEKAGESEYFAEQYEKVIDALQGLVANSYTFFESITPVIINFLGAFLKETINIFLGIVISIYFLISKDKVWAQIKKLSRAVLPDDGYKSLLKILDLIYKIFNEFVVGKSLDSIFLGLLCFLLMTLFSMPYAPIVSLAIGMTAFIPFIGIYIGALFGVFIIFIADPAKVLWFLLIVIGLQQIDSNLIEPRILSEKNGLSALWVLIAIIFMGGFFGLFGLFFGVPIFTVIYSMFKELVERRLKKRELPHETLKYTGE